jgi:hypothetical protein
MHYASTSQVIAGRVGPPQGSNDTIEAFELEVQLGAAKFLEILDSVNDAPLSRFWMPVCARGTITVLAPAAAPFCSQQSDIRVLSRPPSNLLLVTRLQTTLTAVMQVPLQGEQSSSLTVVEANEAVFDPPASGASLILGGPATNPAAQWVFEQMAQLRFRPDFASSEWSSSYRGHPIFDTHAGVHLNRIVERAACY